MNSIKRYQKITIYLKVVPWFVHGKEWKPTSLPQTAEYLTKDKTPTVIELSDWTQIISMQTETHLYFQYLPLPYYRILPHEQINMTHTFLSFFCAYHSQILMLSQILIYPPHDKRINLLLLFLVFFHEYFSVICRFSFHPALPGQQTVRLSLRHSLFYLYFQDSVR